jgi:hypothetical protein
MYCAKHFKEKTVLGPSFLAEEVSQGRDYKKISKKVPDLFASIFTNWLLATC